jgi:tripartite-type tricarboxylate transporter receptor subunit TctC
MTIKTACYAIAAFMSAAVLGAPAGLKADPVADFYKGNQLRMFIGFGAGGANDVWGRAVARHMAKHLPGEPSVIVQHMPGAGSMRLTNYLANVAPRDGSHMGIIARGVLMDPLFKVKGADFDPTRITLIGTPALETTVCAVRTGLPHNSIESFFEHETIVGTGGGGSETNLAPLTLRNVLGMKFKIVAGYTSGGTDVALAIERKELEGICLGYETLSNLALYEAGGIKAHFVVSVNPDPALKHLPNVFNYKMTDEQRTLMRVTFAREPFGRPFIAPPGVPAERVQALRKAFDATMTDPEFLAETQKAQLKVRATSGAELEKFIKTVYSDTSPEIAVKAAKAMGR